MSQLQFNLMPERRVYSVSELTGRIRDLFTRNFTDVLVEGEISNCHEAQSGHIYFVLKDERSQLRAVCFKTQVRAMKFRPENGLHVTVRGSISVYEARGDYQIYVESIEPVGLGALQLAFDQLKKRLEAEGLFSPDRKKPLPRLPRCIGLITSPTGAAVRDVVRILRRRFPNVHLTLFPVRVQGDGAALEIVRALQFFNRQQSVDVLILARGGGSLEDLWAFNEEAVARAISQSVIPVISGVGHETDFTIADFVADVRASTPSAAAELVVNTRREFDKHVADLRQTLADQLRYRILVLSRRVHELSARRGFRRPLDLLRQQRQRADEMTSRLAHALRANLTLSTKRFNIAHKRIVAFDFRMRIAAVRLRLEKLSTELAARSERAFRQKRDRFDRLGLQLQERSPLRVLERGYAIATDSTGKILRSSSQVAPGDAVNLRLHEGRLSTEVKEKWEQPATELLGDGGGGAGG
ncbi:MAG TPA: exodeoxyribonuclease VII large subunit [Candidatus Sulfotelmatobacter sp.]|nr:exodeoxyribonuclease VII large subunit [Candidatus Sulfotelmatobacter sp.]